MFVVSLSSCRVLNLGITAQSTPHATLQTMRCPTYSDSTFKTDHFKARSHSRAHNLQDTNQALYMNIHVLDESTIRPFGLQGRLFGTHHVQPCMVGTRLELHMSVCASVVYSKVLPAQDAFFFLLPDT